MSSKPAVSAVIPHYGESAPTMKLIEKLQQQTFDGEIEIIMSGVGRFWRSGRRIAHNLAQ